MRTTLETWVVSKSRMPTFYRPPYAGARADSYIPLRWQDEVTGLLRAAIMAVLEQRGTNGPKVTGAHIALVRDYCEYYLLAPGWKTDGAEEEFARLRVQVKSITTFQELDAWLKSALLVGIDPL